MPPGSTASTQRSRTVILAGAFPPPVHGFANAMLAVEAILQRRGDRAVRLVTSLGANRGALPALVLMTWGLMKGIAIILVNAPRGGVYYLGISGGVRQVIDAILICFARLARMPFVVHHHSFAYLNGPNRLTRLCLSLCGPTATHVVLCDCMAESLRREYQIRGPVFSISNAALMDLHASARPKTASRDIVVGFLGALTSAKGADNFLSVAETLGPQGGFQFVIAGSHPEPQILERIRSLGPSAPYLKYPGSVYGEEKQAFLASLAVLLFPTKYVK